MSSIIIAIGLIGTLLQPLLIIKGMTAFEAYLASAPTVLASMTVALLIELASDKWGWNID